jgi:hypothetical protein
MWARGCSDADDDDDDDDTASLKAHAPSSAASFSFDPFARRVSSSSDFADVLTAREQRGPCASPRSRLAPHLHPSATPCVLRCARAQRRGSAGPPRGGGYSEHSGGCPAAAGLRPSDVGYDPVGHSPAVVAQLAGRQLYTPRAPADPRDPHSPAAAAEAPPPSLADEAAAFAGKGKYALVLADGAAEAEQRYALSAAAAAKSQRQPGLAVITQARAHLNGIPPNPKFRNPEILKS